MSTEISNTTQAEIVELALIGGDLAKLTPADRTNYYLKVCESLNLNPMTKPFEYIVLNGKLTLYAKKDCTEQLRRSQHVSLSIIDRQRLEDVYIVTAKAQLPDGRTDESTGIVSIGTLKGDALANALMKAETKAKRRVTLSICGLGMLDDSETETIPGAQKMEVDLATGEVLPPSQAYRKTPPQISPSNELLSEKQVKYIHILGASKFGKEGEDQFRTFMADVIGRRCSTKLMTKREASDVIEQLQMLPDYVEPVDPAQQAMLIDPDPDPAPPEPAPTAPEQTVVDDYDPFALTPDPDEQCEKCHETIKGTTWNGKLMDVSEIVNLSKQQAGQQLCTYCLSAHLTAKHKEEKAKKKTA